MVEMRASFERSRCNVAVSPLTGGYLAARAGDSVNKPTSSQ